jgi:hypothetical protein
MTDTADITIVFSQIADSARTMHLASDSVEVKAAREIAIAAIEDGRTVEDAFTFARSALVPTVAA